MEEAKIIHGIIISYKRYGDKNAILGILCDESYIIKGWVSFENNMQNDYMNYELGSQIIATVNNKNGAIKFFIDSIENSLGVLFWNDAQKLSALNRVIALFGMLPENMVFKDLYDKFLNIIAKISISNTVSSLNDINKENNKIEYTCEYLVETWAEFIASLI